jgi:hypothetical protein
VAHLTDPTYTQLLAGILPPAEARDLARHLEVGCEACEAFLASRPVADAVDGQVDAALSALAVAHSAGNDLEFRRILLRLDAEPAIRPGFVRRAGARLVAVAAILAIAGTASVVLRARTAAPPAWDGEKGSAPQIIPLRLRFVVVSPGAAGAPGLQKGVSGQAVPAAASLEFELELGRGAEVALVRVPAQGAPEVIFREPLHAGRTDLTIGGLPGVYPLSGLSGPQRFIAMASPARLDPARLERAAAALAPPARASADLPALDGLSLDVVEVLVR